MSTISTLRLRLALVRSVFEEKTRKSKEEAGEPYMYELINALSGQFSFQVSTGLLSFVAVSYLSVRLHLFMQWKRIGNQLPGPSTDLWFGNTKEVKQHGGFFNY